MEGGGGDGRGGGTSSGNQRGEPFSPEREVRARGRGRRGKLPSITC